jgi:hypothetical protein
MSWYSPSQLGLAIPTHLHPVLFQRHPFEILDKTYLSLLTGTQFSIKALLCDLIRTNSQASLSNIVALLRDWLFLISR